MTDIPEKLIRKLIIISFTSKGSTDEAVTLQPFDISNIPVKTECIISLRFKLNGRYFETEIRRVSKKLKNTENKTSTQPMDKIEVINL